MAKVSGRRLKEKKVILQCSWCAQAKACPAARQEECKSREVFTMFEEFPYRCGDHEPAWYKGVPGVRP